MDASIGLRDLAFDEPFDAAVGRLVLMYLADPAETLRRATGCVRLGGILALQKVTLPISDFRSLMPHSMSAPAPSLIRHFGVPA